MRQPPNRRLVRKLEGLLVILADAAGVLLSFKLAVLVRLNVLPGLYAGFQPYLPFGSVFEIWWALLIWAFFLFYEGLYSKRFSFWDELKSVWKASFFSSVGVFAVISMGKLSSEVSRTVIVLMGMFSLVLLPAVRLGAKDLLRRAGLLKRRVLILGAGETGKLIAAALKKEPNMGYEVIGFVDDDPRKQGTTINGIKVHRGVDSASKYLRRCNIADLIIAMPGAGRDRLEQLIKKYQHMVDSLVFVPDIFGMAVVGTSLLHFFEQQAFALELKNNLERPLNYATKRAFDYVVGTALLVLLALPILFISALIRITSPGPALYRHKRVGRNGRPFSCLKFRTMRTDADMQLQEILDSDPGARSEWQKNRKLSEDPRVTGVGRFLRTTSLDELPQLLNVLAGHMSLVGPRPVTQEEIETYYGDEAGVCFQVLPGITGLWQVSGRSNTGYDYRIALDSWYVRNWNLWLDVVILIKTVGVVFRKEGAR